MERTFTTALVQVGFLLGPKRLVAAVVVWKVVSRGLGAPLLQGVRSWSLITLRIMLDIDVVDAAAPGLGQELRWKRVKTRPWA